MKRTLTFTLILFIACAFSSEKAHGQFFKKLFGIEEKRKPKPRPKPLRQEPIKSVKKKPFEYPPTKFKSRYRIDILVPLYLNDLVNADQVVNKDNVPEKALAGVGFYEGIKLAADTLSSLGYNIDIYIHDISQKDFSPEALLKSNVLAESDLIIGAVQSYQISGIAAYAKKAKINFISAFSPSDADIVSNPFFTIIQPSLATHCRRIIEKAKMMYPNQQPLLFYRTNNNTDSLAYGYALSDLLSFSKKISWNKNLQKSQLEQCFDSTKVNLIIMPIIDATYADNILLELSIWFPNYQFEVYGMPSWKGLNSIRKINAYPNIGVNYTSPFYYDLSKPTYQSVANNYKKQFSGRPIEMVFRGYETLFLYSFLLQKYGTVYNDNFSKNAIPSFSNYDIKPKYLPNKEIEYNENQHLFYYRYQNGNYMVSE